MWRAVSAGALVHWEKGVLVSCHEHLLNKPVPVYFGLAPVFIQVFPGNWLAHAPNPTHVSNHLQSAIEFAVAVLATANAGICGRRGLSRFLDILLPEASETVILVVVETGGCHPAASQNEAHRTNNGSNDDTQSRDTLRYQHARPHRISLP